MCISGKVKPSWMERYLQFAAETVWLGALSPGSSGQGRKLQGLQTDDISLYSRLQQEKPHGECVAPLLPFSLSLLYSPNSCWQYELTADLSPDHTTCRASSILYYSLLLSDHWSPGAKAKRNSKSIWAGLQYEIPIKLAWRVISGNWFPVWILLILMWTSLKVPKYLFISSVTFD